MKNLEDKYREAIWIAHALFNRNKTSGSSANISFKQDDMIYISRSGSCFGTLSEDDFVCGRIEEIIPGASKEWPLHRSLYRCCDETQAVIHVHSPYAVLWSCMKHDEVCRDVIPQYTPYLSMKLGKVVYVPYAEPGSRELFAVFDRRLRDEKGYLLGHHGPIVSGRSLFAAFEAIEELEQSAFVAYEKIGRSLSIDTID